MNFFSNIKIKLTKLVNNLFNVNLFSKKKIPSKTNSELVSKANKIIDNYSSSNNKELESKKDSLNDESIVNNTVNEGKSSNNSNINPNPSPSPLQKSIENNTNDFPNNNLDLQQTKVEVKQSEDKFTKEETVVESNKNTGKFITNVPSSKTETLLEEEYKNLKLDLSELVNKTKTTKLVSYKKVLFWLLNFLTFRWLFSIKLIAVTVICLALFIVYILWNLPDYTILEQYKPKTITRVYSSDGYIISELGIQNRSLTSINNIPQVIKDAFISAEDKTFYTNYGFDFKGIIRASINNLMRLVDKNRSLMGASTITQQVVKNLLLNHDRTIIRKAKEAILTIKLEQSMTKDTILELYLNEIYLGMGSYGITTAALNYFNKQLKSLTLPEAAFLAMLPRSPNGYNPIFNYNGAKARRDWVITRMLEDGKITQEEATQAIETPIVLNKRDDLATNYSNYAAEEVRKWVFNIIPSNVVYSEGLFIKTTINNELQKYSYNSLRKGIESVDNLKGYRGPLTNIFTNKNSNITINNDINEIAPNSDNPIWLHLLNDYIHNNDSVKNLDNWEVALITTVEKELIVAGLDNGQQITLNIKDNQWAYPNEDIYNITLKYKKLYNFKSILRKGDIIFVQKEVQGDIVSWKLKQIPKVNGAMVVMNPINGHILAMQGGYSYFLSQFNRATQALRQPGSAFKAFVYLAALENGMTPSTLVLDAPYTSTSSDKIWRPKNNRSNYAGYVTMRNALEVSRNLASIRIANYAGLEKISSVAKRLGIYNTNIDNFSEVIGSKETTVLKMVRAYSILANGGKNIQPVLVSKISNRDGEVIFKNDKRECLECSNVPWNNQKVPNIEDNRENIIDARDAYLITNMLEGVVNNGIARAAKVSGFDIAGKTGTTNDSKDLWFFGFTPQIVVGIYIGEDNPSSLEPAMASTMVVPIFKDFASQALPLLFDKIPFRIPEGIEMRWIDPKTGKTVLEDSPKKILESFRSDNMPKNDFYQSNIANSGEEDNAEYGIY